MTDDTGARIGTALLAQGSPDYDTPSGATLTLMGAFLDEGNLQAYAKLLGLFAQVWPANRLFVESRIPAQISNFLITRRSVDASDLLAWAGDNKGWEEALRQSLRDPAGFETRVEQMASDIAQRTE